MTKLQDQRAELAKAMIQTALENLAYELNVEIGGDGEGKIFLGHSDYGYQLFWITHYGSKQLGHALTSVGCVDMLSNMAKGAQYANERRKQHARKEFADTVLG